MKKIVSRVLMLSLVSVMLIGLVGCGNKDDEVNPPVEQSPVETVTPTPDVQEPVETPEVQEPVETPEIPEVTMAMIVDTMRNTYGDYYLPSMELDSETFNMLLGIDSASVSEYYSEFYAAMPMMGTHVDKLFVVKTTDTAKMEDTFKAYMDAQIADTMQYPMNVSKLENYSLNVYGDYVVLAILGGYTEEVPVEDATKTPEQIEAEQEAINIAYYVAMNEKGHNAMTALFETGVVPEAASDVVEETTDVEITEGVNTSETESSESTEVTESAENVENVETTEGSEITESSETTETVENTEDTNSTEFD